MNWSVPGYDVFLPWSWSKEIHSPLQGQGKLQHSSYWSPTPCCKTLSNTNLKASHVLFHQQSWLQRNTKHPGWGRGHPSLLTWGQKLPRRNIFQGLRIFIHLCQDKRWWGQMIYRNASESQERMSPFCWISSFMRLLSLTLKKYNHFGDKESLTSKNQCSESSFPSLPSENMQLRFVKILSEIIYFTVHLKLTNHT